MMKLIPLKLKFRCLSYSSHAALVVKSSFPGSVATPGSEVNVKFNVPISSVSAGLYHYLAKDINGNLWSWGSNFYGQAGLTSSSISLSIDDDEIIDEPQKIPCLEKYKCNKHVTGYFHNLVLLDGLGLWSWGSGFLGHGNEIYDANPQRLLFFHKKQVKDIFASGYYSIASMIEESGKMGFYGFGALPYTTSQVGMKQNFSFFSSKEKQKAVLGKSLKPVKITTLDNHYVDTIFCTPYSFVAVVQPFVDVRDHSAEMELWFYGNLFEDTLEEPTNPQLFDNLSLVNSYDEAPSAMIPLSSFKNDGNLKKILKNMSECQDDGNLYKASMEKSRKHAIISTMKHIHVNIDDFQLIKGNLVLLSDSIIHYAVDSTIEAPNMKRMEGSLNNFIAY